MVQGEGGGGLMAYPPWVFDMLQYFEAILPSVESLWSSVQDEVYFMGGGAAAGLWRHHHCHYLGRHLGFYQELEIR